MSINQEILSLNGPITVRNIQTVHAEVLARIDDSKALALELPKAFEGDICFVQLIEAARSYAVACGKTLTLKQPAGEALTDVLRRGGFTDAMTPERARFWLHREVAQ